MTPEEIIESYNLLSQNVKDQAARDAAIIGNSQRSLGPLAARVASPTGQTSGLANYTYNRLMRPAVDSAAQSLTTQGTAEALTNLLNTKLREAKQAYNDAQNNYTTASTAAANNAGSLFYNEGTDNTLEDWTDRPETTIPPLTVTSIGSTRPGFYDVWYTDMNGELKRQIVAAGSADEARNKFMQVFPGTTYSDYLQTGQAPNADDYIKQIQDAVAGVAASVWGRK